MKTVLLYILTVGILFMGLLGILNIGETIAAPPDVSGIWKVENINGESDHRCLDVNSELKVVQSGVYLSVQLNNTSGTSIQGKIRNSKMSFTGLLPTECGKETEVRLELKLQKQGGDKLEGAWFTPDCSNCGQIRFSAIRSSGKGS